MVSRVLMGLGASRGTFSKGRGLWNSHGEVAEGDSWRLRGFLSYSQLQVGEILKDGNWFRD